ncbi:MAG: ABC transporter permease [Clostridiales bacterium]|nr:ABC transporter permease [Clostridiales bacterium]
MTGLGNLIRRNCRLFFRDKGMFFSSLITPIILLVLYVTFLGNVYRDSFTGALPEGFVTEDALLNATVGGQLISSLLAVCCVTVAFCSNLLMVQDRVSGARRDLAVSPVRPSTIAVAYFCASALATLLISLTALAVCLLYLALTGWLLRAGDVLFMLLDAALLTLFGVALSSCVNFPLRTQGQGSAVGTIVSAGYGFLCGAYMPISNFSSGLQKVLSFLPGTYGTSLLRNHALAGAYREMARVGFPAEVIEAIRDSIDCNLYFFGRSVSIGGMYAVLVGATLLLVGLYVLLNAVRRERT